MANYDRDLLHDACAVARREHPGARWDVALTKGVEILADWPLVTPHADADGVPGLLMRSEHSGDVYFANTECAQLLASGDVVPCPAYAFDQPCKHRAAVVLHNAYFMLVNAKKQALITQALSRVGREARLNANSAARADAARKMNELFN